MAAIMTEISRSELDNAPRCKAAITDLKYVASYNWLDEALPTILVPGSPPLWSPPAVPPRMTPDSGMVYIDQNAARSPRYPLEPLFRALHTQRPDFQLGNIDLVTDRNNIRKLLGFVQGSSSDYFEIRVEIAGSKTALFTRLEAETTETIKGFRGFGHNFEKVYTKGLIGSVGHHRIIQYVFGDIKCLVRHETDGYVDNNAVQNRVRNATNVAESLSDRLGALSVAKTSELATDIPVTVVNTETNLVDLMSTVEIKTRAASRKLGMPEIAPQLWVSQTPILVVGYHQNCRFHEIQVRNMEEEIYKWEVANQTALQKLASLIKKIITAVERSSHRTGVIRYDGGTILRIACGEQNRALPKDLYSLWDVKERNEGNANRDQSTHAGVPLTPVPAPRQNMESTNVTKVSQQPSKVIPSSSSSCNDMPFSDVVDHGIQAGLRQTFRRMPLHLPDYHSLCKTFQSRGVDVLKGRKLRDIMEDMRRGKDDWDPYGGRIGGLKSLARDSAFRLLYIFILGQPESEVSDQNAAYNATTFVISHPRIFKPKTRKMVREAFEERFMLSPKQRKGLEKWPIDNGSYSNLTEEEDTTTEEEDIDFDSDWSY